MTVRPLFVTAFALLPTACFREAPYYPDASDASATEGSTTTEENTSGAGGDTDPSVIDSGPDDTGDPTVGAPSDPPPPDPACGNGQPDADEACDDGNLLAGDGCSPTCAVETTGCASTADAIADDPGGGMAVCADPAQVTCEEDFATLCAPGWHLCSSREHMAKNDEWTLDLGGRRALGAIRCRAAGGAGHYTVLTFAADGADNCQIGSSRSECPSAFGCNETLDYALCCARVPTCGDGVVDPPLEECDDGNDFDGDACRADCTAIDGAGPYC